MEEFDRDLLPIEFSATAKARNLSYVSKQIRDETVAIFYRKTEIRRKALTHRGPDATAPSFITIGFPPFKILARKTQSVVAFRGACLSAYSRVPVTGQMENVDLKRQIDI